MMTAILLPPPPAADRRQPAPGLAFALGRGLQAVGRWLARPSPVHQPG